MTIFYTCARLHVMQSHQWILKKRAVSHTDICEHIGKNLENLDNAIASTTS